jgi:peptidoglycan/xylan/chitin deacetylase (PgdA/CDA1 family)
MFQITNPTSISLYIRMMGFAIGLVSLPGFVRRLMPEALWRMDTEEKVVYLTFDDGPTEEVTEFVLDQLAQYGAKATFFCIGKNIAAHSDLYKRLLAEGHSVGNHTMQHANGWRTDNNAYYAEVADCRKEMVKLVADDKKLFRPPYGKMKLSQYKQLKNEYTPVMWDILTCDYDVRVSAAQVVANVVENVRAGSIIVFHDSVKAYPRLKEALPEVLAYLSKNGYSFAAL